MNKALMRSKMALLRINSSRLAELVGMTLNSLSNKINGKRQFTQGEIAKIIDILELTTDETISIFFSGKEE